MLRQVLLYLILSILVVFFSKYIHMIMVFIDKLYDFASMQISPIFQKGGIGSITCSIVLLVLLPVAIASIPALGYRLINGKTMPNFIAMTWCLWLIIILSNILIR